MKFKVMREHVGDRFYKTGDQREANEASVAHLVRAGVLEPATERAGATSDSSPDQSENKTTTDDQTVADGGDSPGENATPGKPGETKGGKTDDQKSDAAEQNKSISAAPKNKQGTSAVGTNSPEGDGTDLLTQSDDGAKADS